MSKSKGRKLAEWMRNLNASQKTDTDGIADLAVTFDKLHTALVVTESDAIGSNDNDTTIATSAAIVDYVANNTPATYGDSNVDAHLNTGTATNGEFLSWNGTDYDWASVPAGYTDSNVASYISGNRSYGNITTTGYIAGPSTFTIDPAAVGDNTGTLVIAGNLQVDGTTTTINSTTLTIDDKNIVLASGAANAAAANGAGIEVDISGVTNPSIIYNSNDTWDFNKTPVINGLQTILRKYASTWTNAQYHDIIYNGWNSNTGDYVYLKAPGNSTSNYGTVFVGDTVFAIGTHNSSTGALNDSATAPIDTTWLYVNSNGMNINGTLTVTSPAFGGISIGESATNYEGWNTQLNVHGTSHSRVNVKTASVRMGVYAHDNWQGGAMGHVGTYTNHQLSFICNAVQRAVLTTAGSLSTTIQGTLWGATNDGSGSGLDADTVDGTHLSGLITTSTSQANNIWIRNTAPTIYFRDTDHRGAMIHNNSNLLYVLRGSQATDSTSWATVNGRWPLTINLTNNDATFGGNVTAYSDIRLKENVEPIDITLDQFKSVEAKRFDWKSDGKHDIGFIAQDVEAAGLVEVVKEHEERDPETGELIETYKTLDYSRMIPFLWDIVQKQQVQIDELKEALNNGSSN